MLTEGPPNQTTKSQIHVLVAGITGFIGSAVTTHLLQSGYTVHGTHRTNSITKLQKAHTTNRNLKLFTADLLHQDSYNEAAKGCSYAIHIASPHRTDVTNARTEIITPCVEGTRNVLASCLRAGVSKVVVISSYTALTSGGAGRTVDETDWNIRSSPNNLPGDYAKTEAEKEAWNFHRAESGTGGPAVIVLNPAVVWGRSCAPGLNASKEMLVRIAAGEMPGVIDLALPVVHVRDVAKSVVRLMEAGDAQGRYVCSPRAPLVHVRDIVRVMREKGLKPSTLNLSNRIMSQFIRLSSHLVPGGTAGQFVRHHVGNPVRLCNRKIVDEIDVEFTDALTTLGETVDELLEKGFVSNELEPPPFDTSKFQALCAGKYLSGK